MSDSPQYEAPSISTITEKEYIKAVAGSYQRYSYGGAAQISKPSIEVEREVQDWNYGGITNTLVLGTEFDGYYPEYFKLDRVTYGFSTAGIGVSRRMDNPTFPTQTIRQQVLVATVSSGERLFFWASSHGCYPIEENTSGPPINPDSTLIKILTKIVKLINKPLGYAVQAATLLTRLISWATADIAGYKEIRKNWEWIHYQSDVCQNLYIYLDHFPSEEASFDLFYASFSGETNYVCAEVRWHLNASALSIPDIANTLPDFMMWVEELPERRYSLAAEEVNEQSVREVLDNQIKRSSIIVEAYSEKDRLSLEDSATLERNKKKIAAFESLKVEMSSARRVDRDSSAIYSSIESISALGIDDTKGSESNEEPC